MMSFDQQIDLINNEIEKLLEQHYEQCTPVTKDSMVSKYRAVMKTLKNAKRLTDKVNE